VSSRGPSRTELVVRRKLQTLRDLLLRRQLRGRCSSLAESSSAPYHQLVTGSVKCFHNHQLGSRITGGSKMSVVGCFGDCGFGSPPTSAKGPREYKLVFHPPIQTILREKDDSKWYTDMVNELATLGDDPNHLNEFGEAPLCVAAFKGSGMIVEEMLKQPNIRVNIKGKHGRTALYLAAEGGHIFIVKLLLQHPDIDVNSRNGPGGATALMGASRRGHSRIVELLLQHPRCEVNAHDKDGNTASQHARTPSVKWRLHNHAHRSRSMETVLCSESSRRSNLCRVSPLEDTSVGSTTSSPPSPDSEDFRRHSLERDGENYQRGDLEAQRLGSFRRSSGSSSDRSHRLSSGSKGGVSGSSVSLTTPQEADNCWLDASVEQPGGQSCHVHGGHGGQGDQGGHGGQGPPHNPISNTLQATPLHARALQRGRLHSSPTHSLSGGPP